MVFLLKKLTKIFTTTGLGELAEPLKYKGSNPVLKGVCFKNNKIFTTTGLGELAEPLKYKGSNPVLKEV